MKKLEKRDFMEYKIFEWFKDINDKTDCGQFIRHFEYSPLDGTFEYRFKSSTRIYRHKKSAASKILLEWKDFNPIIEIRFIPA
jgi:hypothetical protein